MVNIEVLIFHCFIGIKIYFRFVSQGNPWFNRGNSYNVGTEAGMFAFGNANGNANSNDSFRVVLVYYE